MPFQQSKLEADNGAVLRTLCESMARFGRPIILQDRISEVEARIHQLNVISQNKTFAESLNRQLERALEIFGNTPNTAGVRTIGDRVAILQKELQALSSQLAQLAQKER